MNTYWGYHLLVDMAGCNESINNPNSVKAFLHQLVVLLDMHAIGKPIVVYVDTEEGRGVSGVQLITTSTITFHGDANGNCVYLDVFSCKEYSPDVVFSLIVDYFQPKHTQYRWLYRDAEKGSGPA